VVTLDRAPEVADRQSVEVTAYRTPLAALDSPASTRVLNRATLEQAASPTLDGKLREVPGFELFRRTSALVANPTTQGVSLRGLGSTAASRTLVISNDVPLNDPYGGWIHWNEIPELAVESVEVVRGGASDLYGSSAIGGVVNVRTVVPVAGDAGSGSSPDAPSGPNTSPQPGGSGQGANPGSGPARASGGRPQLELLSGYGGEATTDNGVLASAGSGPYAGLFAAGLTATDGYTLVAPSVRGPIDQPSNVHAENGLVELDRELRRGPGGSGGGSSVGNRVFLRGNVLNENRHNGTPLEVNATRLWRYAAGADVSRLSARAFGSSEHYFQSFSAIAAGRASETLTRTDEDPASELGASVRWTQPVYNNTLVVAGGDVRDVRAEDEAFPAPAAGSSKFGAPTRTSARQRQTGAYGEVLATPTGWTLSGSARVDHFTNDDASQYVPGSSSGGAGGTGSTVKPEPSLSETVVDPRLGVSRRITPTLAVEASGFRAYRAPTENELYRTGQVGQQTTLPNPSLRSERATGWEVGAAAAPAKWATALRASYFWTQVNRPITALTLPGSTTATAETLIRENLGQIESRGVSVDGTAHPELPGRVRLTLAGGYQYALATVTSFRPEPALVGKWIPEVARNMGTLEATFERERVGLLSVQARASGRQFDDAENQYELHSYVRFDVYASRTFWGRYEGFAAVDNLLDRSIQAGRTPVLTLATPQAARFGVRIRLGE
jgi:outer membrane receptor protein involved in Fe transport